MDSKNKNFDDIRRLSQSIESKKNILIKFSKYFSKEEIEFIDNSTKLIEDFNNEIKEQEPNIDEYFNGFNTINNILNSYIQILKENNLYISENMKYKLVEQDEPQDGAEEIPGGGGTKEKIVYDLILTPQIVSTDEVVKAFETIGNYGPYVSNLRNTKADVEKAVVDHFGPNQPFIKKKLEKERGKPFPPKTKQAIDTFIRSLTSKPSLLKWSVEGNSLVFSEKHNPTKQVTKNIISTVMKKANINYSLEEKETMNENVLFNIDTTIAFKIYDVLKSKYPQIGKDYTKSSFFYFLNDNIK